MNTLLDHCYLCVRSTDAGGFPIVGANFSVRLEIDEWYSVLSDDGAELLMAYRGNLAASSSGLFAVWARKAVLDALASGDTAPTCMPAREAWSRRNEAPVRGWLRRWPFWRFDGFIRQGDDLSGAPEAVSGAVRRLIFDGQQIPDPTVTPFPWRFAPDGSIVTTDAAAIYRISSITRPAFCARTTTFMGYQLHQVMENEPSRA